MGIRLFKPTSAGRRFGSVLDFSEVTRPRAEKSLLVKIKNKAGRNNQGRITTRHRGGGHKKVYRKVDLRRDKLGIPAKVVAVEYDPNRTANIALLHYADGEKRYIIAPKEVSVGQEILAGERAEPIPGNSMTLLQVPPGIPIHNIELRPGQGGKLVRAAGAQAVIHAKEGSYAVVLLPSGEIRRIHVQCRATIGQVGNLDHQNITIGKAGRKRWMGIRPTVRGSAMNPVSHPMGGGEGRRAGGRHPCGPTGVLSKGGKTRNPRKHSNKHILRKRKKR
ncbi:MAG: 50S ribosomal protein L2 [Planctomycetes bacterium]|nr:50S ribosomal protein L2 [Planctomycetota bacterium]